jgi:hypothetical protein
VVAPWGNIGVPVGDGDHAPLYSPGNLHVGPVGVVDPRHDAAWPSNVPPLLQVRVVLIPMMVSGVKPGSHVRVVVEPTATCPLGDQVPCRTAGALQVLPAVAELTHSTRLPVQPLLAYGPCVFPVHVSEPWLKFWETV